ncbi:SH3 domain-containing protein [Clostridium mediterraneense]|uniref:SH3 domain-containing protein n=1 Tax=Clostridium mediterraneense TaxID=1805472 RepID=UPI000834706C|nr:SH3 domain-containing protein [Clostridium mediterraneense]
MKKIIILVVAILTIGAGAMAYASSKDSNNTQSNNEINTTQSTNSNTSSSSNSNENSNTNTQSNNSSSSSKQNSNNNSALEQNLNNTNSNNESNSKSSPTAVINKFTTSKVINQYGVISNTNKPNNYDGLDWEPNTVKVFSCPDSYSKGIGNLTVGTKVFVLSEQTFEKAPKYWSNSQVGTWAAIKFDNGARTGYVYASTLNIN